MISHQKAAGYSRNQAPEPGDQGAKSLELPRSQNSKAGTVLDEILFRIIPSNTSDRTPQRAMVAERFTSENSGFFRVLAWVGQAIVFWLMQQRLNALL
jgi:hypothetical protein